MPSTRSSRSGSRGVRGAQEPRHAHVPEYSASSGEEAVELARLAGLDLDPWQQLVLTDALGERRDGKWAAFEVGLVVPRQNGKGAILEARELAGLFLLGERLIIHSAHEFATSLEAFHRLLFLIENTPDFAEQVKRVSRSHGDEGIDLKSGQRIRFRTRTGGGGRGFSADCLVLDEAMYLKESMQGALLPTLSARENPQVWYTGSAVDQYVHEHGRVFAKIRARGHQAQDPGLAYFEWSADADLSDVDQIADSPEAWAQANPGLGIRITEGHVALEQRSMDPRTFAVERLSIGDWPSLEDVDESGISRDVWRALADETSEPVDPVCFAIDVRPDRSASAIGVASQREDGLRHIEVVDHRSGTGWVASRLAELTAKHPTAGPVLLDKGSPAAALIRAIEGEGVTVEVTQASEFAQACGAFFDMVEQGQLRHLGTPELEAAVRGAGRRTLGEAWAWSRKSSSVDISPLVACTLALWGVQNGSSVYEDRGLLVI